MLKDATKCSLFTIGSFIRVDYCLSNSCHCSTFDNRHSVSQTTMKKWLRKKRTNFLVKPFKYTFFDHFKFLFIFFFQIKSFLSVCLFELLHFSYTIRITYFNVLLFFFSFFFRFSASAFDSDQRRKTKQVSHQLYIFNLISSYVLWFMSKCCLLLPFLVLSVIIFIHLKLYLTTFAFGSIENETKRKKKP